MARVKRCEMYIHFFPTDKGVMKLHIEQILQDYPKFYRKKNPSNNLNNVNSNNNSLSNNSNDNDEHSDKDNVDDNYVFDNTIG